MPKKKSIFIFKKKLKYNFHSFCGADLKNFQRTWENKNRNTIQATWKQKLKYKIILFTYTTTNNYGFKEDL